MTRVEELVMAVESLPQEEYSQFRRWFFDHDGKEWDQEIEEDSKAGKLDFLILEAAEAKKNDTLKDL
jgi:hypothetical protein